MNLFNYLREVRAELKHVNWPTQRQTLSYTAIVVGLSLVLAIFLGAFDAFFAYLLAQLIA